MKRVKNDFQECLDLVINHKEPEELKYEEHIQTSALKLHGHILHECESENDNVHIVTQLSRSSDDCITLNESKRGGSSSQSASSRSTADYIKAIHVSHHGGKSKSLDHTHNTKITTVIGNPDMLYETVVGASINQDGTLSSNYSFTRRSLPDTIDFSSSVDQSFSLTKKLKKLKKHFKKGKKGKKKQQNSNEITYEEFVNYAQERVAKDKRKYQNSADISEKEVEPEKLSKIEFDVVSPKKEKTQSTHSLSLKNELPFKSYTIGQELPLIKLSKGAKLQRILYPMLSPYIKEFNKKPPNFAVNSEEMTKTKPNAVAVEIKNNKEIHYTLNSNPEQFKQSVDELRCRGNMFSVATATNQNVSENSTNQQCNSKMVVMSEFDVPISSRPDNNGEPIHQHHHNSNGSCRCQEDRKILIGDALYSIAEKKVNDELINKLNSFDTSVSHFRYCHIHKILSNNNNLNEIGTDRFRRKSEPTPPGSTEHKCAPIHPGNESYPSLPSDLLEYKHPMVVTRQTHKSTSSSGDLRKSTVSLYSSGQCYICDEDNDEVDDDQEGEEEDEDCETDDNVIHFNCGECDNDPDVFLASSKSADDDLCSEFIEVIPDIINNLEQEKQIRVKPVHTKYFCKPHCYEHFEKGVSEAIGKECTLENVALLHFLVRCIIKETNTHINSKMARTIKCNAEKFFIEHYKPTIVEKYGTIEGFIYASLSSKQPMSPDVD